MAIKLIALDLDCTLLNSEKKVSSINKKYIHKAQEHGVIVTVSTGRMIGSAWHFAKEVGMKAPVIACNGSIVAPFEGEWIYSAVFDPSTVKEMLDLAYSRNWYIRWYYKDHIYIPYFAEEMMPIYKTTNDLKFSEAPSETEYKNLTCDINQMVICDYNGDIQKIQDEVVDIFGNRINVQQNTGFTMDITPPGIDKSVGLQKLANYLGIKQSEIMAMGDGDNDLAMIEYAGIGVAMENAIDSVKNISNFITKNCNDNGVANAINKYLFGNEKLEE